MSEIKPQWDNEKVPRCGDDCPFRQQMHGDDGEYQWDWCGKTGIALPESDICIPGYRARVAELEQQLAGQRCETCERVRSELEQAEKCLVAGDHWKTEQAENQCMRHIDQARRALDGTENGDDGSINKH